MSNFIYQFTSVNSIHYSIGFTKLIHASHQLFIEFIMEIKVLLTGFIRINNLAKRITISIDSKVLWTFDSHHCLLPRCLYLVIKIFLWMNVSTNQLLKFGTC